MNTTDFSTFLTNQIETRSAESGRRIRSTAQNLRSIAAQLRNDPATSGAADLTERGADIADRLGSYLEQTDIRQIVADAEAFGRDRPWVVAGAGLAAGILASRLLKSTAARRGAE